MTTAAAGTSGASTASPTVTNKGANTAGSPTADAAPRGNDRSAMQARVAELRAGRETGDDVDVDQADETTVETEAQESAEAEGDKSKDKAKKEVERSIPERAFKERLAREKKKHDGLRDQLATKDLDLAKGREALTLALREVERLSGLLQSGGPYDAKDEQIRAHQLANEANQRAAKAQQAHEAALAKARDDIRRAEVAEQLSGEVDEAISASDGLVHRRELIEAMKRRENLNRSAKEVADEIVTGRLEKAKARLVTARPSMPSTARTQNAVGNPAVRVSNDRAGIRERVKQLRSAG